MQPKNEGIKMYFILIPTIIIYLSIILYANKYYKNILKAMLDTIHFIQ